ncbi:MAG TPA: hypothetical protein VKR31_11505 [Rhizomicrobium sp.]|nr:hypothetical protein [Rhizomicrobium sp.]
MRELADGDTPMFQKALAAKPGIGRPVLCTPLIETAGTRQNPPAPSGSAVSACLFVEDDFELNSEFLEVFTRASERVAGFVVGCTAIGVVWLAFSFL